MQLMLFLTAKKKNDLKLLLKPWRDKIIIKPSYLF